MTRIIYSLTARIPSLAAGRVVLSDNRRLFGATVTDIHVIGCTDTDCLFVQGTYNGETVYAAMTTSLWAYLIEQEMVDQHLAFHPAVRDEQEMERLHWQDFEFDMFPESAS